MEEAHLVLVLLGAPRLANAACDANCAGEDDDGRAADPAECPACSQLYEDCDPGDASVNPGAEELRTNGVDDDCDGSTMVRRLFVSGLAGNASTDFTFQPGQRWPAQGPQDGVTVSSGLPLTWKRTPTWTAGDPYFYVNTKAKSQGAACQLKVVSGGSTRTWPLAAGDNEVHVSDVEPASVSTMRTTRWGGRTGCTAHRAGTHTRRRGTTLRSQPSRTQENRARGAR